jgi:hypothetical protein
VIAVSGSDRWALSLEIETATFDGCGPNSLPIRPFLGLLTPAYNLGLKAGLQNWMLILAIAPGMRARPLGSYQWSASIVMNHAQIF